MAWDNTRTPAFILVALLLCGAASAISAGDDTIRAICVQIMGLPQNASAPAGPAPEADKTDIANFTFGEMHDTAARRLNDSNQSVAHLARAGLPSLRAYDLYLAAQQWFLGQSAIELAGGRPDYQFVLDKAAEIKSVEKGTLSVSDELAALSARLSDASPGANISQARELEAKAQLEFNDGRFEDARPLIEQAYTSALQAESDAARSQTLAASARRSLDQYIGDNWQAIAAVLAAALILLFLFQKRIRAFMLRSRLAALMSERVVLENMLRSAQQDYFNRGKSSELSYNIKSKKYGDLVRNINRQIPLLKEELRKIGASPDFQPAAKGEASKKKGLKGLARK